MKKNFVEFVSNTPFSSWLFQGTRHITNPVRRHGLDLKHGSGFGKRGINGGMFDQGFGRFSVMK